MCNFPIVINQHGTERLRLETEVALKSKTICDLEEELRKLHNMEPDPCQACPVYKMEREQQMQSIKELM